ncbi:heme exporter protein CcmD [Dentiradicibacter hellwigii]|uniref:Heme exporter protein D n=1 Tax=Dentiradicibacter hellwigii TaxID=3149053 RepID=A0ABV4UH54_9RHOO
MHWHSFADFLAMGRHGVYVWGSFAVMALVMTLEPLLLVRAHRRLIARLRRHWARGGSGREAAASGYPDVRIGISRPQAGGQSPSSTGEAHL